MQQHPDRQPGDLILDRYMPNASLEERETARANLYRLIAVLFEIERQTDSSSS